MERIRSSAPQQPAFSPSNARMLTASKPCLKLPTTKNTRTTM